MAKLDNSRHIHHHRRHFGFSYPVSVGQKFYTIVVIPVIVIITLFVVLRVFSPSSFVGPNENIFGYWLLALLATLMRLFVAYGLALVIALPLAFLIYYNPRAERILLPLYDIIESVPVLAFFPVIILFFVKFNFFEGAAIFVIFLGMLWNMVFSVVGGLKSIPAEIKSAAQVFNLRGLALVRQVLLPAIFPNIITGSLLAWAQGWNIIIVAEVLHTYLPDGTINQDLFGIGSILVNASAANQGNVFLAAILVMVATIGLMNFFVWQKLLQYAERYKFE